MRTRRVDVAASSMAIAIGLSAPLAFAQVTPGQVGDTLKPAIPLQTAPRSSPPEVPSATPRVDPTSGAKTIVVDHFAFEGNTLIGSEELQSLLAAYRDKPVTLLDIYNAADKIASYYASRGYALASVNVPPQKVENGVILLQISEGRIGQISVEGASIYRPERIKDQLPDVKPGTIYNGSVFRDSMRQVNALPGIKARAILKPGEEYGTSDMVVRVDEDPFSASAAIDNYGRENIGEFRLSTTATLNSPSGVGDQLNIVGLISEHSLLRYAYIDYSLPIAIGTRVKISYSDANFEVDDAPVDGKTRSGGLSVERTSFFGNADILSFNAGISRTESNADFTGLTFISTKITLLEIGALWTHNYRSGAASQFTTSMSSNFNRMTRAELLNASASDPAGDQRFRWEIDAQHLQPLPWQLQLLGHVNAVYSPDPLVDTEAYSLGGPNSVRGFPAAEIRGDRGFLGSLSLRRPMSFANMQWAGRIFFDAGKVFSVDPTPGSSHNESLTSAGLGLDWAYWRMSARLDWSIPLDNRQISDGHDNSRVFGTLSIAF